MQTFRQINSKLFKARKYNFFRNTLAQEIYSNKQSQLFSIEIEKLSDIIIENHKLALEADCYTNSLPKMRNCQMNQKY